MLIPLYSSPLLFSWARDRSEAAIRVLFMVIILVSKYFISLVSLNSTSRRKNFFPVLDFRHTAQIKTFHSKYLFASRWNFFSLTVKLFFSKYQISPNVGQLFAQFSSLFWLITVFSLSAELFCVGVDDRDKTFTPFTKRFFFLQIYRCARKSEQKS